MAASAALLPLDQSRLASTMSEDVSSARQRRRRTISKKPESQSLTKRGVGEGNNGLELSTLENSSSPRNWPRMRTASPRSDRQYVDHREKVTTIDITVETTAGTGKQRHSHRRKKARQQPSTSHETRTGGVVDTLPRKLGQTSIASREVDLQDSTDGVAAILQTKLDQLELEDRRELGVKDGDQVVTTPRSDPGHSSGIVTESEEEAHVRIETAGNTGG